MPETKGKTLEEIDLIFQKPTRQIVRENMASSMETTKDFFAGRWGRVFNGGPQRGLSVTEVDHEERKF